MSDRQPMRSASQVTLKTVFTVCFGVLAVVALVYFVLRTQFAMTLALGAALIAVALNHVVEALGRRGVRRRGAVLAVVFGLLAFGAGLSFLIVPPLVSRRRRSSPMLPRSGTGCAIPASSSCSMLAST